MAKLCIGDSGRFVGPVCSFVELLKSRGRDGAGEHSRSRAQGVKDGEATPQALVLDT